MKLHTEKEHHLANMMAVHWLRNLYRDSQSVFYSIIEHIPAYIHLNNTNHDIVFANNNLKKRSKELDNLAEYGSNYLEKISCPILLNSLKQKTFRFINNNDDDEICSYFQRVLINDKMTYFYSHKMHLDESKHLVFSNILKELGSMGKVFLGIIEQYFINKTSWQRFFSLTKQEKEIVKLLAKGNSNTQISDLLFISSHTVHTHRRNIYQKLDIHNTTDLVKISLLLDII